METQKFNYYYNAALRAIAELEGLTSKMFQEAYPELNYHFETAVENKITVKMQRIAHELYNRIDEIKGA